MLEELKHIFHIGSMAILSALVLEVGVNNVCLLSTINVSMLTTGRRQSKTLSTIDERGSKIDKQCFRLPFVASVATNGKQKNCF